MASVFVDFYSDVMSWTGLSEDDLQIDLSQFPRNFDFLNGLWFPSEESDYLLTRNPEDLEHAICVARNVHEQSVEAARIWISLSWSFILLHGPPESVMKKLVCAWKQIKRIPQYNLARLYFRNFQRTRETEDLTKAVELFRNVLDQVPRDCPQSLLRECRGYLCISMLERDGSLDEFLSELSLSNVDSQSRYLFDIITYINLSEYDEVFDRFWYCRLAPRLAKYRIGSNFGVERYTDGLQDLEAGIEDCQHALRFFFLDSARTGVTLFQLGSLFLKRHLFKGTPEDIDEAVLCFGLSLKMIPSTSEYYHRSLRDASIASFYRFQAKGKPKDLDDSRQFAERADRIADTLSPTWGAEQGVLGGIRMLCYCFTSTREATQCQIDLNAAIAHFGHAVSKREGPAGELRMGLQLYGYLLLIRFVMEYRTEDINEAIVAIQRSLDLSPCKYTGPVERESLQGEVNQILFVAFIQLLNNRKCLDHVLPCIQQGESSVQRADHAGGKKKGDTMVASVVSKMFSLPSCHKDLLDSMNECNVVEWDFERAVEWNWERAAEWHSERAVEWDLGRAVESLANVETPLPAQIPALPTQCILQSQLLGLLSMRAGYLHLAIHSSREAIRRQSINTGADFRAELKDKTKILEMANLGVQIMTAHEMIKLMGSGVVPTFPMDGQFILGMFYYFRYENTGSHGDGLQALAALRESFQPSHGLPICRIAGGHLAVDILSELERWDQAYELAWEIINLLVIVNGRSLNWESKQIWMRDFSIRASSDVAIALQAGRDPFDAINLLETCRGSILGQLIDDRAELSDLAEIAPQKADRFRTLLNELNMNGTTNPLEDAVARMEQTTRRIEAEKEFCACLEEIRTLQDFHGFLRGPVEQEIKEAAARGPIVIVNVSGVRSDAIIITKDSSALLPLPELTFQKVNEYSVARLTSFSDIKDKGRKNKKYRQLQEWLWIGGVKPILDRLELLGYGPAKFHVWWIPVDIAGLLPFHAAGIYTRNSNETALSRVISSYTPTLKVMIHSRQRLKKEMSSQLATKPLLPEANSKPRLTIITMPTTPGESNLNGVEHEAEAIQTAVLGMYSTQILVRPSARDTMACTAESEIVHYACHGYSDDGDPSSSHLLLQTSSSDSGSAAPVVDKLTLRDVAATDVRDGKLAFLSACSTAEHADGKLWDEALHLASGFHAAGYLHAIGSLWPTDDAVSVNLVQRFYERLVEAGELGEGHFISTALNEAMMDMAKTHPKEPLSWAQYVHFGV